MMFMNKTKEKEDFRVRKSCSHICSYKSRRLKLGLTHVLCCVDSYARSGVPKLQSWCPMCKFRKNDGVQQRFNKSKPSDRPLCSHTQDSLRLVTGSPITF